MKVKKNDTVLIITGKDAGKKGKVLSAFPTENRIKVDGVNIQKRAKKARSAKDSGGIIEQVGAINVSNAMVICPSCDKATRVHYGEVDGKKIRVCAKCGASLEQVKEVKATKGKKTTKAKTDAEKKTKKKTTADAE